MIALLLLGVAALAFFVREEDGKARVRLVDDTGKVVFEKP